MVAIATWNVLADAYLRPEYYPRVEPRWLAPGARLPGLVARLQALPMDVWCLQEVEAPVFTALQPALPAHQGHFALKGRDKPDGVAVFSRDPGAAERLEFTDGTGHVALLFRPRSLGFTVAVTHLRWSAPGVPADERPGVREARELVAALGDGPCVVCGDLNAAWGSAELRVFADAGFVDPHPPEAFTANPNGRLLKIDFTLCRGLSAAPRAVTPLSVSTPLPAAAEPSDHLLVATDVLKER